MTEDQFPKIAIRPYPNQYVSEWKMNDGTSVRIRPIRPEDEPLMVGFHEKLSEHTVYMRYFDLAPLSRRVAHERLTRMCFLDYDREMAFVAEHEDPKTGAREIIAVGRLIKIHNANEAEAALLVRDQFQHRGLGTELLRRLVEFGRDEKLNRIIAEILPENREMQHICEKLGFSLCREIDSPTVKATFHF